MLFKTKTKQKKIRLTMNQIGHQRTKLEQNSASGEQEYEEDEDEEPGQVTSQINGLVSASSSSSSATTTSSTTASNNSTNSAIHANLSFSGDSQLIEENIPKKTESIKLVDYEGVSFEATYLVSNGPGSGSGSANMTFAGPNGVPIVKKKMFYCEKCPYKTNNYCNLKQHLLQHRFRDGFFKCRYCPYFVSMIRLLKQHEILHGDYVPRENTGIKTETRSPSCLTQLHTVLPRIPVSSYSFPK